jgi:hypothetical protein
MHKQRSDGNNENIRNYKIVEKKWKDQTSTAFKGTSPEDTAAITLITSAATLTVSWNWMNF